MLENQAIFIPIDIKVPALGDNTFQILFNKQQLLQSLGLPDFNMNELLNSRSVDPNLPNELNVNDDDHNLSEEDDE